MIILQLIDVFDLTQLTNILWLLIVASAVIALVIIAVSLFTSPKALRGGESGERQEISPAGDEDTVGRGRAALTDRNLADVLNYLRGAEATSLDSLMTHLSEDRETINAVLTMLKEEGIVEISGGVVMLTEKGKKKIDLMREKYWFKEIEKREE